MRKLKYLDNETIYKDDAYLALHERFDSQQQFEDYYSRLKSEIEKNEFLRVSVSYLFFVKNGDWKATNIGAGYSSNRC